MSGEVTANCPRVYTASLVCGTALGYGLARMGFSDYGALHAMFTFADLRLMGVFAGALALCALAYRFLSPPLGGDLPKKPMHPGVVPGGVLFGLGWVLTGACPAVAFVHLGEGRWIALATIAGVLFGTWIYRPFHARFLKYDRGSCAA